MSISRITEVKSSSPLSFEDALKKVIARARRTPSRRTSNQRGFGIRNFYSMPTVKYPTGSR